jgi:hypothetical protein
MGSQSRRVSREQLRPRSRGDGETRPSWDGDHGFLRSWVGNWEGLGTRPLPSGTVRCCAPTSALAEDFGRQEQKRGTSRARDPEPFVCGSSRLLSSAVNRGNVGTWTGRWIQWHAAHRTSPVHQPSNNQNRYPGRHEPGRVCGS